MLMIHAYMIEKQSDFANMQWYAANSLSIHMGEDEAVELQKNRK